MVVAIDEKADRLIQRDRLDELMRIDNGFRKSSAAYAILVSSLMVKDDLADVDRRVLLNLQADMIYKAERTVAPRYRAMLADVDAAILLARELCK